MTKTYGMKTTSLLQGIEITQKDLDFLCSLAEDPDESFPIKDAVEYSFAIVALTQQLDYMREEISHNELTEDEDLITLTKEQLLTLHKLSDAVEDAIGRLRLCGISLKQN